MKDLSKFFKVQRRFYAQCTLGTGMVSDDEHRHVRDDCPQNADDFLYGEAKRFRIDDDCSVVFLWSPLNNSGRLLDDFDTIAFISQKAITALHEKRIVSADENFNHNILPCKRDASVRDERRVPLSRVQNSRKCGKLPHTMGQFSTVGREVYNIT